MSNAVADEILQDFANNARQWSETQQGDHGTPGDEKLIVRFEDHPHLDDAASRDANRPIFKMMPYIKIMIPGDKDTQIHRPVREGDKTRFAKAWLAFQSGQSQVQGFPLSEWPKITRAQVEELKYFNIRTIEDLANVNDSQTHRFMGIHQLRDEARRHLELLKEAEPLNHVQAELKARDETIATMQAQIAALMARRSAEDETPPPEKAEVPSKGK
jgi:hypothetical protein